jgi:thiol-disulfide isomerase/thioredoxin
MRAAAAGAKRTHAKRSAVTKDSKITLVYVGADNCPPCRAFIGYYGKEGRRLPELAPELAEVRFVNVSLMHFTSPVHSEDLPEDLAWLLQPAANGKVPMRKRGTPYFIGVVDKRVVARGHGTEALKTLVVPEIRRAVEERRAAN